METQLDLMARRGVSDITENRDLQTPHPLTRTPCWPQPRSDGGTRWYVPWKEDLPRECALCPLWSLLTDKTSVLPSDRSQRQLWSWRMPRVCWQLRSVSHPQTGPGKLGRRAN